MRATNWIAATLAASAGAFLNGCADIDARVVDGWDDSTAGVRYYMPEPYFLVTRSTAQEEVFAFEAAERSVDEDQDLVLRLGRLREGLSKTKVQAQTQDPPSLLNLQDATGASVDQISVETAEGGYLDLKARLSRDPSGSPVPPASSTATVTLDLVAEDSGAHTRLATVVIAITGDPNTRKWKLKIDAKKSRSETATTSKAKAEVVYLPNPERIVAIEPSSGIGGTNELDIELVDGWKLKSMGSKSDAKTPETLQSIAALIESAAGAAAPFFGVASEGAPRTSPTRDRGDGPELWRLDYNPSGSISRLVRVELVDAPPH